jgi:formamidopyrimidine-DNA glycosylase
MYADEALFSAGIHPLRPANSLSPKETRRLHRAIRRVLSSAIGNKGASVSTYLRPGGELGSAQLHFRVAHQGGKTCPVCGMPIQRIPIRGRGSYFCPRCQPEKA